MTKSNAVVQYRLGRVWIRDLLDETVRPVLVSSSLLTNSMESIGLYHCCPHHNNGWVLSDHMHRENYAM